ncbi:MAG: hypothetical protein RSA91_01055 [Bacilli bacterium]
MNYFNLYKKRGDLIGLSCSENRVINMIDRIEEDFENDESFRKASVNFNTEDCIDTRFSEDKANLFLKYFLFKPNDNKRVKEGMYLTIKEGIFLLSEINMNGTYRKGEAYICNQILRTKGLKDIPCYADNTTYGVKGLTDNNYFKESDKKLKIKVQANNVTLKYYEGQRFLFGSSSDFTTSSDVKNEWVCYMITSKDFTVLKNQYVLELTKTTIEPGKDDVINGIAYNEANTISGNIEEKKDIEYKIISKVKKVKVGTKIDISILPCTAELRSNNDRVKLSKIKSGEYKCEGINATGYSTLNLVENNKILTSINILVY